MSPTYPQILNEGGVLHQAVATSMGPPRGAGRPREEDDELLEVCQRRVCFLVAWVSVSEGFWRRR